MCRDPRDQNLVILETNAHEIVGNDWHSRLDKVFIENLGKFRKYDGKSVQDLLRALRNKVCRRPVAHHFSVALFFFLTRSLIMDLPRYRSTTIKTYPRM